MKAIIESAIHRKHIYLTQGIVYDTQPTEQGMRDLHLSLLTPYGIHNKEGQALPCVVWVCGGGWRGGRERHSENLPDLLYLAENGYIIAAAEYRVIGEAVFPAQIRDVLSAVRFLRKHCEEYHIDPERIAVMGASAGGHLTLLAANNDGQFDTESNAGVSSDIKCAVDFYGIADIRRIYDFNLKALKEGKRIGRALRPEEFGECRLLGDLVEHLPETAIQASGVCGINEHTCPVLVMHGDSDHVVNIEQSELYYEAMEKAGKDIRYYVIKGADHGSDEFYQEDVRKIVLEFLGEKL